MKKRIHKINFLVGIILSFLTPSLLFAAEPGTIKWRYPLNNHSCYSLAIGHDNTIYAPSENNLLAVNPDGTLKWSFEAGGTVNTPSVGPNGNIYFQAMDGVYSLNSGGDPLWLYNPKETWAAGADCSGKVSIGQDGTIYVSYGGDELHAIDSAGNGKWVVSGYMNPAISADGNIYAVNPGGRINILNKEDGSMLAYSPTSASYINQPTIGSNGNIYVIGQGPLNTFSSDLTKLWETENLGNFGYGPGQASVGMDGVIYINIWNHLDGNQYLHAINPDGTRKWNLEMSVPSGTPAIGNNGIIYVAGCTVGAGGFSAIDEAGNLLWTTVPIQFQGWTSPIIGNDGTVYVIGGEYESNEYHHHLYAINTSSTGPANSSWPMMGANAQHTHAVQPAPVINPIIAQTPMSGSAGATFTQWGDGFTPNTTGKLWTRNPDGSELYIQDVPMDETGHFEITYESRLDKVPGTYVWWVVDGGVGEIKSNEVSYEITEPLPVQVTLTLNIDPQTTGRVTIKPSGDVCETGCSYNFESGTQLELLSDANASWKFECWSDGTNCISSDNPFVTVIEMDRVLTARFVENQAQPRRFFALLVGVNNYPKGIDKISYLLPGKSHNWIFGKKNPSNLKKALLKYNNWEDKNIEILKDEDATKENVMSYISSIGQKMNPEDLFLFYFNGHGASLEDLDPYDEAGNNNKDEYILTYGKTKEEWIRDDELKGLIEQLKIPNMVAIIQSCYSGGVARDLSIHPNVVALASIDENSRTIANVFSDYVINYIDEFEGNQLSAEAIFNNLLTNTKWRWDLVGWPVGYDNYPPVPNNKSAELIIGIK